jgi:hypothetical protein
LRRDTIQYPWHPFFGIELQVAPFRRGKQLKLIITDLLPGYSREVPLWMFDADYCSGMAKGAPEISVEGLTELARLLGVLGKTRKRRATSAPSESKEKGCASIPTPKQNTAQAAVRSPSSETVGRHAPEGRGGDTGRSASGSSRRNGSRGRRG